jgi:hypothetical protein
VSDNQNKSFLPTGISAIMADCVKAEILMSNTIPIQKRGATRPVGADGAQIEQFAILAPAPLVERRRMSEKRETKRQLAP